MAGLFISDVFTSHAGLIMPSSHINYGGSRREATRFRYKSRTSLCGFVELAPTCVLTADQLYKLLQGCEELVERVEWQSNKVSQGHVGDHMCERNIKVFPRRYFAGSATDKFLEFGITRNAHMSKNTGCPYTVTVMFKEPPKYLVSHAWEILRHICKGNELFPDKVDEWMKDVLGNCTCEWAQVSTILLLAHNLRPVPLFLIAEFVLPQRHYVLDFCKRLKWLEEIH